MNIAIVGAGIAGTTAAWQFANNGHSVTLFEQAAKCGPVGAGILLQPSGQMILHRLGLLDAIARVSPRIASLHARHQSGKSLVRIRYDKLGIPLVGLGVLRGNLFDLLLARCRQAAVSILEGHPIESFEQDDQGVELTTRDGDQFGPFDMLVVADGSRSRLRDSLQQTRRQHEYPDAAFWTVGPYSGARDCLLQIVGRCGRLVGMLPVGDGVCSFFWGLKQTEVASVRKEGIEAWKEQVIRFLPSAEDTVDAIDDFDQLTYGTYRDVRLRKVTKGRVVLIGDAAHASSPHLGQGLNLALEDALLLADQVGHGNDYHQALDSFETLRRRKTSYYSALTGMLTPYFQTSNRLLQFGRDLALPIMPALPYVGRQMSLSMAGLKTGWFSDGLKAQRQNLLEVSQ